MRVDRKRLAQAMEELGRVGATPRGGLTRLALRQARPRPDGRLDAGGRHHARPARARLDRIVAEACRREGVTWELDHYWRVPATPFAREVVDAVERAAAAVGARHRRILSGAGHDAQYMAAIGPTGMIFVPSRDGRSHCEEEFTPLDDVEHGANTLLLAALDLAGTP